MQYTAYNTMSPRGAWRTHPISLVEVYVPFTAYQLVALSPDPPFGWNALKNLMKSKFDCNLRLSSLDRVSPQVQPMYSMYLHIIHVQ